MCVGLFIRQGNCLMEEKSSFRFCDELMVDVYISRWFDNSPFIRPIDILGLLNAGQQTGRRQELFL